MSGGRDVIDRPQGPRPGEDLDVGKVLPFLRHALPDLEDEAEVLQFPAGYSNLTYLLRVGGRELVLRRPPPGSKPASGHDMKREYTILDALHGHYPYCPKPVLYVEDPEALGCPFYVMERIRGIIVRRSFPPRAADHETVRAICEGLVDALAELHLLDRDEVGLSGFGHPEGYVERQVEGWSRRYRRARTPDVPDFEEVMSWLARCRPVESPRPAIIHNDFKLDNVVLDPQDPRRLIGVLDWEMATVGDPLMDLGETLSYWIQDDDPPELRGLAMTPTDAPGALRREEIIQRYAAATGCAVDHLDFYYCFGLFRLAVISQQIYYRYYKGQSHDPRFGMLGYSVRCLESVCRSIVDA